MVAVEHADLERVDATFSWMDGTEAVFMNGETFEVQSYTFDT